MEHPLALAKWTRPATCVCKYVQEGGGELAASHFSAIKVGVLNSEKDEVDEVEFQIDSDDTDADPSYSPAKKTLQDDSSSDEELPPSPKRKKKTAPAVENPTSIPLPETTASLSLHPVDEVATTTSIQPGMSASLSCQPGPILDAAPTQSSTAQISDPHIIVCDKVSLRGKNGHRWTNKPTLVTGRNISAARNIIHIRPGPTANTANKIKPSETFNIFFTQKLGKKVPTIADKLL
ncbi:hypothetical protein J6590_064170 [Homalodisca vitripennis]|nr:hypothetical protein J6590_064170 [Homalodisca vitripennis]